MESLNSDNNKRFILFEHFKRNKLKRINPKKTNVYKYMIYTFFIFIFFLQIDLNKSIQEKKINYYFKKFNSNEITLKIKGKGEQRILNAEYKKCPNFIYLNNGTTNILGTDCHLVNIPEENDEINIIKLIWSEQVDTFYSMFSNLEDNLIEVDLSNFDSSNVTNMFGMFFNCYSLESINFLNVNTSKVETMRCMFADNYALKNILILKMFI